MKRYKLLLIITLCAIFLGKTSSVKATGLSLGVYPPIIQVQAKPSTTVTHPITLINNSDHPESVSVIFKSFTSSDKENGEVTYLSQKDFFTSSNDKLFKHIALIDTDHNSVKAFILAPHQKKTFTLVMDIPQDVLLSDYYFSILFFSTPDSSSESNNTGLGGAVGMHVLLTAGDETPASGYIKTFDAPSFVTHGPVPFTIELANNGLHMINPQGVIIIKNMFGQKIGKVDLLPVDVLATSKRFMPDILQSSDTRAIWHERFLLGRYSAQLKIALSAQGPVLEKNLTFFAVPFQMLIAILLGLSFIFTIIIRVRNRLK